MGNGRWDPWWLLLNCNNMLKLFCALVKGTLRAAAIWAKTKRFKRNA